MVVVVVVVVAGVVIIVTVIVDVVVTVVAVVRVVRVVAVVAAAVVDAGPAGPVVLAPTPGHVWQETGHCRRQLKPSCGWLQNAAPPNRAQSGTSLHPPAGLVVSRAVVAVGVVRVVVVRVTVVVVGGGGVGAAAVVGGGGTQSLQDTGHSTARSLFAQIGPTTSGVHPGKSAHGCAFTAKRAAAATATSGSSRSRGRTMAPPHAMGSCPLVCPACAAVRAVDPRVRACAPFPRLAGAAALPPALLCGTGGGGGGGALLPGVGCGLCATHGAWLLVRDGGSFVQACPPRRCPTGVLPSASGPRTLGALVTSGTRQWAGPNTCACTG